MNMALLQRIHSLNGRDTKEGKKKLLHLCVINSLYESIVQVAIQPGKEAEGNAPKMLKERTQECESQEK